MKLIFGLLTTAMLACAFGGCASGAKVWSQKYEDDTVQAEYEYYRHPETNRRVKHGWYNSYQPNGEYDEVGVYKDGKRDGRWTAYYPSGRILREENYKDGMKNGKYVLYLEDGGIREEGEYKDGIRQGQIIPEVKESYVPIEQLRPNSPEMRKRAPDQFDAKFETSAGDFVISVTRELSPNGVDRFYNLVRNGFYNDQRFFRVLPGFVVQWGMHGDPHVSKEWQNASISDDPVRSSNTRGTITFAKTNMRNSRTTQLFINLGDNSDNLDGQGFAPFGSIASGMEAIQAINAEYQQKPNQQRIGEQGNAYLNRLFPNLDYIKKAYVFE